MSRQAPFAVAAAVAATIGLALVLLPGSSSASPRDAARRAAPEHVTQTVDVCLGVHVDLLGLVAVDLGVDLHVGVGGTAVCSPPPPPPPPTTTTTAPPPPPPTTTTTALPPPPPTTMPTPQPLVVTSTTTAPTTTTTTAPPPPPPPPPPPDAPPPRLTARVMVSPEPPAAGEPATATVVVQNHGGNPATAVTLVDEVSASAGVRSATTPGGACATTVHQASCELGPIPAGGQTTAEVRLLMEEDPASRTLVQRISLSSAGAADTATTTTASTLLAPAETSTSLLALPGTTVTLVAFVGFVLAARSTH